jgi:hypothetical protein
MEVSMLGAHPFALSLLLLSLASPSAAAADAAQVQPTVVMTVPWGAGPAGLSRTEANESEAEGPASFAVAPDGDIWVLDQVAARVVRFDPTGRVVAVVLLPSPTFQDLEVWSDGRLLVLDRLVRRTVLVVGPDGADPIEHSVRGPLVPEPGAITALLARPDGVWLEVGHAFSFRLLDAELAPVAESPALPGRVLARAGGSLELSLRPPTGVAVAWRDGMGMGPEPQEIELGPVLRLAWAEDVAPEHFWLIHVTPPAGDRGDWYSGALRDRSGTVVASFEASGADAEWSQVREFRVLEGGDLLQMELRPEGVRFLHWRLP